MRYYATTRLRICMNSSMKQPIPSGVSLNECLLKGPPALADLYTETLGVREHKVAFTKDISKFHQCIEEGEIAQQVRRILWRFSNDRKEPEVFVTTKVNCGDRPAGCMDMAAVRKTAERFGLGREEAPQFLKKRTYVDDALGGAHDNKNQGNPRTWRILSRTEAEQRLQEMGYQEAEICIDVKINYGEKNGA